MENVKQFVFDYLEGRVSPETFMDKCWSDPTVFEWLQSIVPKDKKVETYTFTADYIPSFDKYIPYIVKDEIEDIWNRRGSSYLGKQLNTFDEISRLILEAFPNLDIKLDTSVEEKFDFMLVACPDYLYSIDVGSSGIFEKLFDELPKEMSKTKRIKEFRERIKAMFYVEGHKYPRWIQGSEWPLSKSGKPTKFIRQESILKGEGSKYYFLDVDTGEEIEIIQAY